MRRWVTVLFLIVALSLMGACASFDHVITKKSEIDKAISTARADTQAKMEGLTKAQTDALSATIKAHEQREQAAADFLFKGQIVSNGLKSPTRPEQVITQSINQTATQLPPASPSAQAKTLLDLQTELDEARISNEDLRAKYDKELAAARAEGEAKVKTINELGAKVTAIESEKVAVLERAGTIERDLQAKKDALQDAETAKARDEAARAKRNETLKRWLMAGLGVISLITGAAAVYLPMPSIKGKLTGIAIVAALLAFAVPFVEPWHVLVAILVVGAPIGLAILADYRREHNDATDTYRGLNEAKVKVPDAFAPIESTLKEWHDPSFKERLKDRLKHVGDI